MSKNSHNIKERNIMQIYWHSSRYILLKKVVLRVVWRRYMQYRFVVTQMQKSAPGYRVLAYSSAILNGNGILE